jgi:membrane protein implicated in regulation of membrane protease activity
VSWTWFLTGASLVGVVANIYRRRWCFAVWLVTNTTWAVYDFSIGATAQGVLFSVYAVLAVWGLWTWRKPRLDVPVRYIKDPDLHDVPEKEAG